MRKENKEEEEEGMNKRRKRRRRTGGGREGGNALEQRAVFQHKRGLQKEFVLSASSFWNTSSDICTLGQLLSS